MISRFVVHGSPVGKARPRAAVINGFARVHNTKENQQYESYVIDQYLSQIGEVEHVGMIKISILVYYSIEKAHYKKKGLNAVGLEKEKNVIRPTKKPDIDNIAKIIMDALNGVAYKDDAQVVGLTVEKYYFNGLPSVEIEIRSGDDIQWEK